MGICINFYPVNQMRVYKSNAVGLTAAVSNPCCPPVSHFDYTPSCHVPHSPLRANVTRITKLEVSNVRRGLSHGHSKCTQKIL